MIKLTMKRGILGCLNIFKQPSFVILNCRFLSNQQVSEWNNNIYLFFNFGGDLTTQTLVIVTVSVINIFR